MLLATFICASAILVMTKVQLPVDSIFFSALQNSGHVLIFCFLTLVSLFLFSGFLALPALLTGCAIVFGLMAVGFGIEVIQRFSGRGFDFGDQLMNLAGIAAGFFVYYSARLTINRKYIKGFACALLALLILLTGFFKPITIAINYFQRPSGPMLADFEEPNPLIRFFNFNTGIFTLVKAPKEWPQNSSTVLKAETLKQNRVRIQMREPHPDWRNYHSLYFEIFVTENKTGRLLLMLRDRDNWRNEDGIDAYLNFIKLTPGLNQITVPLDTINQNLGEKINNVIQEKPLDMSRMQEVVFLVTKGDEPRTVLLDNITLQ